MSSSSRTQRIARAASAVVVAAFALGSFAPRADAHVTLTSTDPVDGSVLAEAPKTITINFGEAIANTGGSVTIRRGSSPEAIPVLVAIKDRSIVAALGELVPDIYRVDWQVLDKFDLHPLSGTITFAFVPITVQGPERARLAGAATAASLRPPSDPEWPRFIDFAARAAMLFGALALAAHRLFNGTIKRFARLSALVLALGLALQIGLDVRRLKWDAATSPAAIVVFITVALWLVGSLFRRQTGKIRSTLVALAATALIGHGLGAGVLIGAVRVVHVVGIGLWIGALVMVVSQTIASGSSTRTVNAQWAIAGAAAVTSSGLLLAARQIDTFDGLFTTRYGIALIVKLAMVAAIGYLGLKQYRSTKAGNPPDSRRMLNEVGFASAAIVIGAFLGVSAPPRGPVFQAALAPAAAERQTITVGDLKFSATIKPNRPGANFVDVDVLNSRRPAPAPIAQVRVALYVNGARDVPAAAAKLTGTDRYSLQDTTVDAPGTAIIHVEVDRPGKPTLAGDIPWTVPNPPQAVRSSDVSRANLAPWAIAVAIFTMAFGVVWWKREKIEQRVPQ